MRTSKEIPPLYYTKELLKVCFDGDRGIKSKDKDRVFAITGYEGMGKSNLLLHIFEYWVTEILGEELTPEHIQYIGDNKKNFVHALFEAPKYMMVSHDEAGKDLYSRKSQNSFNTDLNVAYQVIRGSNLFTILVIPSILDLDTFFRKRRVSGLFHVYKEGKVAYFGREELNTVVPYMTMMSQYSANPDPMKCKTKFGKKIQAVFLDRFLLYRNKMLLEPYLERKKTNIEDTKKELFEKYNSDSIDTNTPVYKEKSEDFYNDHIAGLSNREIAKLHDTNSGTVNRGIQYFKKTQKI
jgi:hypothetical protein